MDRKLFILPLAVFMGDFSSAQELNRTPPVVEVLKAVTLQDRITSDVQAIYNQYTGNTSEIQGLIDSEVTVKMKDYVSQGLVEKFTVVCDDRNNPPDVVDKGFVLLFVLWRATDSEPGIYNKIIIGPDQVLQRLR